MARDGVRHREGRPAEGVAELEPVRLLRPREAADILAISARKLWELSNRGEIPTVRIGRCMRYFSRDLVAWIERRRSPRR